MPWIDVDCKMIDQNDNDDDDDDAIDGIAYGGKLPFPSIPVLRSRGSDAPIPKTAATC